MAQGEALGIASATSFTGFAEASLELALSLVPSKAVTT